MRLKITNLLVLVFVLSGCSAVEQVVGQASEAQWAVNPEAGVGPGDTVIPLLVREVECASGQPATGRMVADVDEGPERVVITVSVRVAEGDQACPSNPLTPFTIELDQPLGDRELVNGATSEIAQRPIEELDPARPPDPPARIVPAQDVPEHVMFLAESLVVRADNPEEFEDIQDLSPHPDGVELWLGDQRVRTVTPEALAVPDAWVLDVEEHAGRAGPFSALDLLAGAAQVAAATGAQPHCTEPPRTSPDALAAFERVALVPTEPERCAEWFVVNLYVDGERHLRAVQVDLSDA